LYRNPTRGSLTLEFPASERSANIRVMGTDGKVYLTKELLHSTLGQEELDFSELLPAGLYLLEFRGPLGRNLIRFVKN
jgi:hypothetical protein